MVGLEFEEKVDIDDLVLPSKPMKQVEKGNQHAAFESDHDEGKKLKLKMKENILKLYEELDKEKSENSTVDFSLRRLLKIRDFVEKVFDERTNEVANIKEELNQVKVISCYKKFKN